MDFLNPHPKASDTLLRAKNLISDPLYWTQDAYSRDIHEEKQDTVDSKTSICYCSEGAVRKVTGFEYAPRNDVSFRLTSEASQWLQMAAKEMDQDTPMGLNDNLNHAAVMRMFDRAIELAKKYEK